MPVAVDILRTYVNPRLTIRKKLADSTGEGQALAYLLAACAIHFCSRLPLLSRQATDDAGGQSFPALAAGQFVGAVIVAPLAFYAVAAASRLIGRAFRGKGGWLESRIALFWSLLSTAPIGLLAGAASILPFEFAPIASNAISWVAAGAFAVIWTFAIVESENPP